MPLLKRIRQVASSASVATDAFLESYVSWRAASADVRTAYECWGRCAPPQRGLAFDSYRAALEREEDAARMHADRIEELRAAVR